jgi:hypothetical protein
VRWAALLADAGDVARKQRLSWRVAVLPDPRNSCWPSEATLKRKARLFLVPESPNVTHQQ